MSSPAPETPALTGWARLAAPVRDDLRQLTSSTSKLRDSFASFEAYRRARLLATARLALLVGTSNVLLWLPTDFWVFRDDAEVRRAMILFRVSLSLLGAAAYWLLRRAQPAHSPIVVPAVAFFFAVYSFGMMGIFSPPGTPLIFTSFFVPTLSVAFLLPLRQRIVTTLGISLAAFAAFCLPHPQVFGNSQTAMIFVFLLFGSLVCIIFGHMMFQLEQTGFEQHRQVRQSVEKLEELNRMKDSFVATVSHELRTPLNAIIGLTDVVLEEKLPAQVQQYVRTIHNSGEVLLALINDILDLAKIKSGKVELEATPFSPSEVIETTINLFAVACQKKGLELSHYMPPDLPLIVGDPGKVNQILLNLIGNAVKFTESGEIRVEVSWQAKGGPRPMLSVSVADTGPGIPDSKWDLIFDEFTQADTSTTRRFGGTGLGLPIVRRLARLMGGDVTVSRNEPHGCVFVVSLPVTITESASDSNTLLRLATNDRPALAIVSVAHELRRRHLTDQLRAKGLKVEAMATLPEVATALARQREDGLVASVCIVDQPGLTPEQLGKTPLVSRFGRSFVPLIVIVDIRSATQHSAAFQKLGVDSVLTHPLRRLHLREILRKSLESGSMPALPAPEGEPSMPVRERAARLLVADDVPENQLLINAFLTKLPVQPVFVENGQQALEKFTEQPFDLVVLDIEMPVMDGYTALQHMREWEQAKGKSATPIVALTAHGSFEHQERAREAGFSHHLAKPVRKRDFLWLLNHFVYGSTPSSSRPALSSPASGANEAIAPEALFLRASYLHRRREELKDLRQHLATGDFNKLASIGHKLKGSGASYGLVEVSAIGKELEEAAQRQDATEVQALIERLGLSIEQSG